MTEGLPDPSRGERSGLREVIALALGDVTSYEYDLADKVMPVLAEPVPVPQPPGDGRRMFTIGGGWGHHVSWLNDGKAKPVGLDDGTVGQGPRRVYGHLPRRPKVGDRLTSAMQSGRDAVFVFTEVTYKADPPDMFFGTVEFVEYAAAAPGVSQ